MSVMRSRLSTGIAISALLLPPGARAHTPGLSMADFEVRADGQVQARLTFSLASAEPLAGTRLDRDGDGVVTPDDLLAARDDLRAFVAEGVEVAADGSPCEGTFRGASLSEVDGLELRAAYACPGGPAVVQATLYYLSASAAGPRRALARILSGGATTEGVLTGERRAISLHLTRADRPQARIRTLPSRLVFVPVVGVALALLAWRSRIWRAARATWQNRAR
jgi:hypothetical protein